MKKEYKRRPIRNLEDAKVTWDNFLTGLGLGAILALIGLFGFTLSKPQSWSSLIVVSLACITIVYMKWEARSIRYFFITIFVTYWIYFILF